MIHRPLPRWAHRLVEAGCRRHGVAVVAVRGSARHRYLVNVRKEIAAVLRFMGLSYPAIGAALGGRHHTGIMYYLGEILR